MADENVAQHSAGFFKSGPGEYGEGDQFLGIRVPVLRSMAKKHRSESLPSVLALLKSKWHEERLLAALLLVQHYQRGSDQQKDAVFNAYWSHRSFINNWDIVDSSAHLIVGPHLDSASRKPLFQLAKSRSLWDRRIAMMSTYHFIRQQDFEDALRIADVLLHDEHDLIHKVVGWMLREIGNRDRATEVAFLKDRYQAMPRTMLRYAIEKFSPACRKAYLHGKV